MTMGLEDILGSLNAPEDTESRERQAKQKLIAGLAEAFEQAATAGSRARTGQNFDGGFYDRMRGDADAERQAALAQKQQLIKNKILGKQLTDADADRTRSIAIQDEDRNIAASERKTAAEERANRLREELLRRKEENERFEKSRTDKIDLEKSRQAHDREMAQVKAQNKPEPLTKGQEALDRDFGQKYANWLSTEKASADSNLAKLEAARATIKSRRDNGQSSLTGRGVGRVPEIFKSDEAIELRDTVQSATVEGLRAALGNSFTEKEGERITNMSYNEKLPDTANLTKIEGAIKKIKDSYASREAMNRYFEANGTLKGYKPGQESAAKKIRVRHPNGTVGLMPAENVEKAKAAGYEVIDDNAQ